MAPVERPPNWVGREDELAILGAGAQALRRGEGAVVWVEGEAGIGKSSLVAQALATAADPGWDVGWGIADRLTERLPLRVMLDCLQVRPGSPDPRRAKAAELLRSERVGLISAGDASAVGVEILVTLADELCAAAPTVIVIDDVQWADAASLLVWHQLAASINQLRLLLIATGRLSPARPEVRQMRGAVARRGAQVITLGPLSEKDVTAMVTKMLASSSSDDALYKLTAQAAGNPLYVRELIDALVRERTPPITGDGSAAAERLPVSLASVLSDRLTSVSAETERILQTATLLGGKFTVTDLAVLLRRPALELAESLQEAVTAGILAASGPELAFRHSLIRQFLYEGMPAALRTALHAEAARELATTGADALSVAQQLFAAGRPGGGWARTWLVETAPVLVTVAPQLTADLLQRELAQTPGGDKNWDGLTASLARALLAAGSHPEAARQAGQALSSMTDPVRRAETYFVLADAQLSMGRDVDAAATVRQALASAELPNPWRPRMLALLAMLERASTGDLDAADATARRALAVAREAADASSTAHALVDLWLTSSIRRDHVAALDYLDQALAVLGDDADHTDLRSFALDSRIFTLQNLDRWPDAELALGKARESARRSGSPDGATWASAAVLRYWLGQWDDALAELGSDEPDVLGPTHSFLREHWSALLVHGVAALIAGRRDQRVTASQQLRLGLALPILTIPDRENQDFLLAAHAVALEQNGEPGQAMRVLAGILPRRDGEMTLIHQWLPDLVRLALAAGDDLTARTAAAACAVEAEAETHPARAAAKNLRCQGLLASDPAPLHDAVAHYRRIGPAVELPAALEDLAAVLAKRGQEDEARFTLTEAIGLYESLDARWDIRRAEARLQPYGIRRGTRVRRPVRAASGWEALTPTEVKIAYLIGDGRSNPDVAERLFMSRNTVQTHVSHILAKLNARSRAEIVREVVRQGIAT
jgi:DNA-binding CsgD family transcriptional regulator/tetratricopeptide (TPR) repeat protein